MTVFFQFFANTASKQARVFIPGKILHSGLVLMNKAQKKYIRKTLQLSLILVTVYTVYKFFHTNAEAASRQARVFIPEKFLQTTPNIIEQGPEKIYNGKTLQLTFIQPSSLTAG